MQTTQEKIRGMADLGPDERREIVAKALVQNRSQGLIARDHGIARNTVSQIIHQHRKSVAGGRASASRAELRAAPKPTIRRFSWEGVEA